MPLPTTRLAHWALLALLSLVGFSAPAFAAGSLPTTTMPVTRAADDLTDLGMPPTSLAALVQEAATAAGHPAWFTHARQTAVADLVKALDSQNNAAFLNALSRLGMPRQDLTPALTDLTAVATGRSAADIAARDAITAGIRLLQSGEGREARMLVQAFLDTRLGRALEEALSRSLGGSQAPRPAPSASPFVLGYYEPGTGAYEDLLAHYSQISAIAPVWYSFAPDDNLNALATGMASLTAWCHAHGVAVYPLVINGYGNDNMLQSASLMRQDVSTLVQLAAQQDYNGFNIDFESLNNPDEAGLNQFVSELAQGLHQEGKKLIVSVGPRTSSQNGYHVYDYASLGASADYIDLMTYDDHDNGGPSGPVAPIGWVDSIVHYAEATIPHQKILVGLAGYGYNWARDGSTEINDSQAQSLANTYGETWVGGSVGEDEISYTDANGCQHVVWYENSTSEQAKAALVSQGNLGGVALWDLGEENAGVWPMLAKTLP